VAIPRGRTGVRWLHGCTCRGARCIGLLGFRAERFRSATPPRIAFQLAAKSAVAGSPGGRQGCSKCIGLSRRSAGTRIAEAQMGPGPRRPQPTVSCIWWPAATYAGLTTPLPLFPMQDGSICDSHVNFVKKTDDFV
jgi:hypothetical protein